MMSSYASSFRFRTAVASAVLIGSLAWSPSSSASCKSLLWGFVASVRGVFVRTPPDVAEIAKRMRSDLERILSSGVPDSVAEDETLSRYLESLKAEKQARAEATEIEAVLNEVYGHWRDRESVEAFEAELLSRTVASGRWGHEGVLAELEEMAVELNGGPIGFAPTDEGRALSDETFFALVASGPFVDSASSNSRPDSRPSALSALIRPHGTHSHLYQWVHLARKMGAAKINRLWKLLGDGRRKGDPRYGVIWTESFDMPGMRYSGPLGPYWIEGRLFEFGRRLEQALD